MTLLSKLFRQFSSRVGVPGDLARRRHSVLGLEALEGRLLPAVDFTQLVSGLRASTGLGALDGALNTIGTIVHLPVLKTPLKDIGEAVQKIKDFESTLPNTLSSAANQANNTALQMALFQALGPGGINMLGDNNHDGTVSAADVSVSPFTSSSSDVTIGLRLSHTLTAGTHFDFDLGLPGIPLKVDSTGNVLVQVAFDYNNLTFGMQNGHFFMDNSKQNELSVTLDATIPNTTLSGTLGFLQFTASDPSGLTDLRATFTGDVTDTGLGTFGVSGRADVHLALTAGVAGSNGDSFPSIGANFDMGWDVTTHSYSGPTATFGGAPTIAFNHVHLNLGTWLSNFIKPVVKVVQAVTKPIQPVIDLLVTPLPGLSDLSHRLGGGDVTLLSLVNLSASSGQAPPETQRALAMTSTLVSVLESLNQIDLNGPVDQISLDFGSFDLAGGNQDLRSLPQVDYDLTDASQGLTTLTPNPIGQVVQNALDQLSQQTGPAAPVAQDFQHALNRLKNDIKFEFSIFGNPVTHIFKVLLGQDVDIVTLSGQYAFHTSKALGLNFYGVEVGLQGTIDGEGSFKIGYDTHGIREFIQDVRHGNVHVADFLDGLYLDSSTHFNLKGSLTAYAGINVGDIFKAEIHGGITTGTNGITLSIPDPNHDGKLRIEEIPQCHYLIQTAGELDASVFARVQLGADVPLVGFVGVEHIFPLTGRRLLDLTGGGIPNPFEDPAGMQLAAQDPQTGFLTLNMGSLARRLARNVEPDVIDEVFTVSHDAPRQDDPPGEAVIVSAFGYSQRFKGVTKLTAFGDDGNDTITIQQGVQSPAELHGGAGDDDLAYLGGGAVTMHGDDGDDALQGGSGSNTLYGDKNNDHLTGGSGSNVLDGGADDDVLIGGTGPNTMTGGPGNDDLIAGPRGDHIDGGAGDNRIYAGAGNDDIFPGTGNNSIFWQVGNGNPTLENQGTNTLHVQGSRAADTFEVSRFHNGASVHSTSAGRTIQAQAVQTVEIDGGPGIDSITVNDLRDTTVHYVNVDLGQLNSPDFARDKIVVNGSTGADHIVVEKQSGTTRPGGQGSSVHERLMSISGMPDYTVRVANDQDDLTIQAQEGNDTVEVLGITGPTLVDAGAGDDSVVVDSADYHDLITPVVVEGGTGSNSLDARFSNGSQQVIATVSSTQIGGSRSVDGGQPVPFGVYYRATNGSFAGGISLKTWAGNDKVSVVSTRADCKTTVNTGDGNDSITIGSDAHSIDGIVGAVVVNGGNHTTGDALHVDDRASTDNRSYTITSSSITWTNGPTITYSLVESVDVTAGTGNNTVTVQSLASGLAAALEGTGGSDTLVGPDVDCTWTITGPHAGQLTSAAYPNSSLQFSNMTNLTGGAGADVFVFQPATSSAPAGQVPGDVNGGAGIDTLDYSSYTIAVHAYLTTGDVTAISGHVSSVENVTGGSGDDVLIGDAQANVLQGGLGNDILVGNEGDDRLKAGGGRNLLIGGRGKDVLTGGTDQDILIGAWTAYDANVKALTAILSEWSRPDATYLQRIDHLMTGGGKNGSYLLTAKALAADKDSDILTTGNGLDWLIYESLDVLTNPLRKGEVGLKVG